MLPSFILRLAREVDSVVAIKECSGDARRLAELLAGGGDGFEVLVGGDDWALEGFAAGATGWISGVSSVAPEECVALLRHIQDGELEAARAHLHAAAAARPARHDAEARAVLQGRAGRRRPRRRPVPAAAARAHRRGSRGARRGARRRSAGSRCPLEGGARLRRRRLPHGGHADPGHHRRGRPAPRRHDARPQAALRGRARRPAAAADARAARARRDVRARSSQPPTRPDADWGVLFIEVSGCLPMCGHGTIGVATVLVETGMVAVTEPETVIRLDTPAGLVEVRVAVEDGEARSVTLRNVPAFLERRDAIVELDDGPLVYDLAFGGNFYAIVDAAAARVEVEPEHAPRADRGGRARDGRDRGRRPAGAPRGRADRGRAPRHLHRPRARRRRRPRRGLDPPRLARPLARAGPGRAPAWRSCTPAASSRSTRRSCTSR